jgi:hypothetical protein
VTVWFLSKRVFSEGQAEDAILLGFMGVGQWRERGKTCRGLGRRASQFAADFRR